MNAVTLNADMVALGGGLMMALGVVVGYAARWLQVRKVRAKLVEDYRLLDRACYERGCMQAQYPARADAVKCVIEEVK